MSDDSRSPGAGMFASASTWAGSITKLLGVRVSYALLELADARDALLRLLLVGAAALATAVLALISLSALIVLLCWDALGWVSLLLLFVVYAGAALLLLRRARRIVVEGQLDLSETMAELRKDHAAIFGAAADDEAA